MRIGGADELRIVKLAAAVKSAGRLPRGEQRHNRGRTIRPRIIVVLCEEAAVCIPEEVIVAHHLELRGGQRVRRAEPEHLAGESRVTLRGKDVVAQDDGVDVRKGGIGACEVAVHHEPGVRGRGAFGTTVHSVVERVVIEPDRCTVSGRGVRRTRRIPDDAVKGTGVGAGEIVQVVEIVEHVVLERHIGLDKEPGSHADDGIADQDAVRADVAAEGHDVVDLVLFIQTGDGTAGLDAEGAGTQHLHTVDLILGHQDVQAGLGDDRRAGKVVQEGRARSAAHQVPPQGDIVVGKRCILTANDDTAVPAIDPVVLDENVVVGRGRRRRQALVDDAHQIKTAAGRTAVPLQDHVLDCDEGASALDIDDVPARGDGIGLKGETPIRAARIGAVPRQVGGVVDAEAPRVGREAAGDADHRGDARGGTEEHRAGRLVQIVADRLAGIGVEGVDELEDHVRPDRDTVRLQVEHRIRQLGVRSADADRVCAAQNRSKDRVARRSWRHRHHFTLRHSRRIGDELPLHLLLHRPLPRRGPLHLLRGKRIAETEDQECTYHENCGDSFHGLSSGRVNE